MHGKYYLTEKIKPIVNKMGNVAFTADDVLFDWISFKIPRGTCAIKSVFATVAGTDGAAGNDRDMDLLFAQTVYSVITYYPRSSSNCFYYILSVVRIS